VHSAVKRIAWPTLLRALPGTRGGPAGSAGLPRRPMSRFAGRRAFEFRLQMAPEPAVEAVAET